MLENAKAYLGLLDLRLFLMAALIGSLVGLSVHGLISADQIYRNTVKINKNSARLDEMIEERTRDRYHAEDARRDFRARDAILADYGERISALERKSGWASRVCEH